MKAVVWNCRGAGGPLTISQLKEVLNFHSSNVVFLCETKNHEKFMRNVRKEDQPTWLVYVYASTASNTRKEQWKYIEERKKDWGEAWVIVGDFNDLKSDEEKWGGRERAEGSFTDFNCFIRENNLMDLEYQGVPWTWSSSWEGDREVKERLDRCLCSTEWMQRYEKARCKHVETEASNHLMLIIDTNPENNKRRRRFYFDQRWTKNPETKDVIQGA
ncbi:uncharacterized protein [Coffea arabica]|uniref:Endonuclease/exonuclease/phosphatase domain-containing protein n=1 Tax=Coffea arabica TaxID=13443 RepID=A0ABM4WPE4_COFAR